MIIQQMRGAELEKFFSGGYAYLAINKENVNALNVFPVPDGDTGINMALTMGSAVKNIAGKESVAEIAKTVSNGALMGARGNSGVILSQIFRGFSQGVGKKEALDANDFAIAMRRGVDLAYKAVMRPVEGTILTVCKHMALAASAAATEGADIIGLLERVLAEGQKALDNTPNQLPVLKQAGVVDAGGKGLLTIFEGGYRRLLGEEFSYEEGEAKASAAPKEAGIGTEGLETASIQYPYCTELIVKGKNIPLEKIQAFLKDKGDSQVAVGDASLVKIHIHTKDPGAIFSYMLQFGTLHNMKIDNMQEQYETKAQAETDEKPVNGGAVYGEGLEDCRCAVVTVSSGDGIKDIFLELGAACIINGGQSYESQRRRYFKCHQPVASRRNCGVAQQQ